MHSLVTALVFVVALQQSARVLLLSAYAIVNDKQANFTVTLIIAALAWGLFYWLTH